MCLCLCVYTSVTVFMVVLMGLLLGFSEQSQQLAVSGVWSSLKRVNSVILFLLEAYITDWHTMESKTITILFSVLSVYLIRFNVVRKLIPHYFSDDVSHCIHYRNGANNASSFKEYSFRNEFFFLHIEMVVF